MLIAIDTGGTKTLVASFHRDGKPHECYRFLTPNDPREYLEVVSTFLKAHYDLAKIHAIVIAVPGMVRDNVAMWCDNLGWKNFDIADGLKKMGITPRVFLENDANLAGLGEVRGLAKIPQLALYVTVSTGIGTGIIINGHLVPALSNSEAGHSVLAYKKQYQEWEVFASGKALREKYGKMAKDIPINDTRSWQEIAEKISVGLLAIIPALQPETIIIGGSIGTYFNRYGDFLKEILSSQLSEHLIESLIIPAKHPEEAVIYGCYCYGSDKLAR